MNQDSEQMKPGPTLLLLAPSFLVTGWLVWQVQWYWRAGGDLGFGWLAPVLGAVLFWKAWGDRPAVAWKMRWWALLALLPGVGMLFLMQIYQASMGTNAASTMGLALGVMLVVMANLGIVFGWRGVAGFGMAYALLLCALPLPTILHAPVVAVLGRMAAVNVEVLNLAGVPAELAGREIVVAGQKLNVVGACRGQGTMQFAALASLFFAWFAVRGWGRRIGVLVGGALIGVLGYFVCSMRLCLAVNAHGGDAGAPSMWMVWGGIAVLVAGIARGMRHEA